MPKRRGGQALGLEWAGDLTHRAGGGQAEWKERPLRAGASLSPDPAPLRCRHPDTGQDARATLGNTGLPDSGKDAIRAIKCLSSHTFLKGL